MTSAEQQDRSSGEFKWLEAPAFLIVDDDPQDRTLAVRALRQVFPDAGAEEITAPDELADSLDRGRFDLVVTDYQLNWTDGLTVLQAVKDRYPERPVVLYTDSGNEEIAVEALKSGADDYVIKSSGKEHRLAHAVRSALERAQLRQREGEALRLRDAFLTVAAHELKTPITSLLGYAQFLERRINRGLIDLGLSDRRAVESMVRQAERLRDLVQDLLNVSQLETGALLASEESPVDLCEVARAAVEEVRLTLERHTVEMECPGDPVMVVGNPQHLERVIQNLLENAVKYSPAGGSVTVGVRQAAESAEVAVSDQGIGVSAEDQARIFDRFYRGSHPGNDGISGFGIGLYIVHEIVRKHGGSIEVDSAPGRGSTFTVRLPLLTG